MYVSRTFLFHRHVCFDSNRRIPPADFTKIIYFTENPIRRAEFYAKGCIRQAPRQLSSAKVGMPFGSRTIRAVVRTAATGSAPPETPPANVPGHPCALPCHSTAKRSAVPTRNTLSLSSERIVLPENTKGTSDEMPFVSKNAAVLNHEFSVRIISSQRRTPSRGRWG